MREKECRLFTKLRKVFFVWSQEIERNFQKSGYLVQSVLLSLTILHTIVIDTRSSSFTVLGAEKSQVRTPEGVVSRAVFISTSMMTQPGPCVRKMRISFSCHLF